MPIDVQERRELFPVRTLNEVNTANEMNGMDRVHGVNKMNERYCSCGRAKLHVESATEVHRARWGKVGGSQRTVK